MKKRILVITMAIVMVVGLTGCTKTKTVSYTDENGTTTTTTTTTDKDGSTASVIGPVNQEPEYSVIESEDGYKVTFNPECFEYEEGGEYEEDESVYIRCTIDEENAYENYINVRTVEGYTAEDLIDGLAHQNDTEASPMHIIFAKGEYDAYYCETKVTDSFILSFYVIPGKDSPYLVEVGSHIYSDDDEYAYYVSGVMEETFLDLEFDI